MLARIICMIACIAAIAGNSFETSAQTTQNVRDDRMVSMPGTDSAGNPITIMAYKDGAVTVPPRFPGGDSAFMNYVNDTREYPEEAYNKRIQGVITCQFLVDTNGEVKYVSLLKPKDANSLLVREAIRILSTMPRWQPGMLDGVPVKVRVTKRISFRR